MPELLQKDSSELLLLSYKPSDISVAFCDSYTTSGHLEIGIASTPNHSSGIMADGVIAQEFKSENQGLGLVFGVLDGVTGLSGETTRNSAKLVNLIIDSFSTSDTVRGSDELLSRLLSIDYEGTGGAVNGTIGVLLPNNRELEIITIGRRADSPSVLIGENLRGLNTIKRTGNSKGFEPSYKGYCLNEAMHIQSIPLENIPKYILISSDGINYEAFPERSISATISAITQQVPLPSGWDDRTMLSVKLPIQIYS